MRAAVYLRQSQDRDGTGLGVARQLQDCERLCVDRGWEIVERITDNDVSASGRKPRPGFDHLRHLIDSGSIDIVVAWHVDRLVRKLTELEDVIERCEVHGVKLATVSGDVDLSTDAGRLVGRILASVARGEVERKATRQRRAQLQAAESGKRVGGRRPFGYEQDGATIRPVEGAAVREGYRSLLSGVPLAAIARDWNERGLRTGQSGEWKHDNVRHVLANARYAGLRAHRGEVVGPAIWPALVSEDTYRAVLAVLSDPARRNSPRSARALLTGLALCRCGSTVHGGRTSTGSRTYRCRAAYGHVGRRAEPVDEYVGLVVVARLSRPDAADLLISDERPDVDALRDEATALRARMDSLANDFADGVLTASQLRSATERMKANLAGVEAQMADAGRVDLLGPLVRADDVGRAWAALVIPRQRAVVETLMAVTLLSPGRGTRTFRPETVSIDWRSP